MFGADRRERLTPIEIVVRRGRVAGVRVRPRDETIGCHHLLWAGSAAALLAALSPEALAPHKRPQPARVTGYRYSLAALVEPDALPADMPSRLLAVGDPSRALTEDNAVAITVGQPNPRDPRRIPLWVECGVPANLVEAGASYLRSLRGRVTHVVRRLLPGVRAAHGHARLALRRSARRAPRHPGAGDHAARLRCPRCRRRRCSASRPSARSTSSASRTRPA